MRETATDKPTIGIAWPKPDYLKAIDRAGGEAKVLRPDHDALPDSLDDCDGILLTGGADVDPSRYGDVERHATVTIDKDGKFAKAEEKVDLHPGPRPKCHATKLLDPDPVVRAIVEQDLLIMGKAAKPYLDEQRAKAAPELQAAIDRIWERILAGER